jgi:hypothetical protein
MPLNSIFSWLIKKRIHQIELFNRYPMEVQLEQFHQLLHQARYTEWGKKYDYQTISNYSEYKERVPLQQYETMQPFIERVMKGEQNILWPSDIKWFAKSSGTTSAKSKFIPVSHEALYDCHYKGGKDLLGLYCHRNPASRVYSGRTLLVGGSAKINSFRENEDSYYGDLSAIIIKNLPMWVELRKTPSRKIALMDEWEEKIEKMAHVTTKQDVHMITGVPSWTMVLFNRVLEITGKDNISEVWPNLELFAHGGVNFSPYREQFKQMIPKADMNYVDTYNASEGFFGIQDTQEDEMLLMLDYGIFYEFIPMDKFHQENPPAITLDEVEPGVNYAIVISTNSGLWRYVIGDTVKFTSTNPYRIKVTGRTKHFINAFGEELIIDNAANALTIACERTNCTIRDYTAGPIYMTEQHKNGGHEWLIEFEEPPKSLSFFIEVFDNALKSLNSDYEAKRSNDLTLRPPTIRIMPAGTFYDWLKSKGKLGGQHKVPRLTNNRTYVEEILAFTNQHQVINA